MIKNNGLKGRSIISPPASVSLNMALDQALFDTFLDNTIKPIIRLYTFNERAITYGYFQKINPGDYSNRKKSRRITGGGVVLHGKDIIITFIFNPLDFNIRGVDQKEKVYKKLQETVENSLIEIGVDPTRFTSKSNLNTGNTARYECFEKIVSNDVVYDGRKVAGFALKRVRGGIMVQSSLRVWSGEDDNGISLEEILTESINHNKIRNSLISSFSDNWKIHLQESTLTEQELLLTKELMEKYNSNSWNYLYQIEEEAVI